MLPPRNQKFCAAIEPWHGEKVVVYLLDGDGSDEIIAGYRGKGTSLFIYKCADGIGRSWERIELDKGDMAASGLVAADINGDGRVDIAAIGTSTDNIKWYENTGR